MKNNTLIQSTISNLLFTLLIMGIFLTFSCNKDNDQVDALYGNYIGERIVESVSYKIVYDSIGDIIDVITIVDTTLYKSDTFQILKSVSNNSFKVIGKCELECFSKERVWEINTMFRDSCLQELLGYYNKSKMIINTDENKLQIESIVKSGNSNIHPPEVTKCQFVGYKS